MRTLLLLIVLLFSGNAAQSQEPPPTPAKTEQKQQAHPKQKQQRTSPDKRGTESSPLFIKVIPPLAVEPRSTEHAEQANDYASSEWWLVWVTLILAVITAILACYTAKLWGATKTLAEDARNTADRQAGDTQESLFMARDSIRLAREEFISTHRPKLIVRRIAINISNDILEIEFVIANIGATSADIMEVSTNLLLPDTRYFLPAIPPYGASLDLPITLESGASVTHAHRATVDETTRFHFLSGYSPDEPADFVHGSVPMIFFGFIAYKDQTIIRRRETAFLRTYDFTSKRFTTVNDPDYEYQD